MNEEILLRLVKAPDPVFDDHWEQIVARMPQLSAPDAMLTLQSEHFQYQLKVAFAAGKLATLESLQQFPDE